MCEGKNKYLRYGVRYFERKISIEVPEEMRHLLRRRVIFIYDREIQRFAPNGYVLLFIYAVCGLSLVSDFFAVKKSYASKNISSLSDDSVDYTSLTQNFTYAKLKVESRGGFDGARIDRLENLEDIGSAIESSRRFTESEGASISADSWALGEDFEPTYHYDYDGMEVLNSSDYDFDDEDGWLYDEDSKMY